RSVVAETYTNDAGHDRGTQLEEKRDVRDGEEEDNRLLRRAVIALQPGEGIGLEIELGELRAAGGLRRQVLRRQLGVILRVLRAQRTHDYPLLWLKSS